MEWSIWGVIEKSAAEGSETGAGSCGIGGAEVDGAKEGGRGAEEEAGTSGAASVGGTEEVEASDLLDLAFLGPLKVTIGSSRFQ